MGRKRRHQAGAAAEPGLRPLVRVVSCGVGKVPGNDDGHRPGRRSIAKTLDAAEPRSRKSIWSSSTRHLPYKSWLHPGARLHAWDFELSRRQRLGDLARPPVARRAARDGREVAVKVQRPPAGATGGRILTTLVRELVRGQARYGVEARCIAGGQGSAALFELV